MEIIIVASEFLIKFALGYPRCGSDAQRSVTLRQAGV